jgi:transposase
MKDTTISVDVAKSVFEIAVSLHPGHVAETHRLPRPRFAAFFAARKPTTVVMEAKGILEAFRNQAIHPVPVKTVAQQALAALHRLRSRWMATRTSRINTVRGVLREFGLPIPVGSRQVVPAVRVALEDADSGLPDAVRPALAEACDEIRDLEVRIASVEHQLEALARETPVVPVLRSVPGIGLLTATAMVAVVGDAARFPSGRHFASFVGLTPRESSTGLRRRLGAISKRGDAYLRMLLVHGARSVLCHAKKTDTHDRLRTWALDREQRRGHNKAAVALANKLARIAWAVWTKGVPYQDTPAA